MPDNDDPWANVPDDANVQTERFFRWDRLTPGAVLKVRFLEEPHKAKRSTFAVWEALAEANLDGNAERVLLAPSSVYLAALFKPHRPLNGKTFAVTVEGEGYGRRYKVAVA